MGWRVKREVWEIDEWRGTGRQQLHDLFLVCVLRNKRRTNSTVTRSTKPQETKCQQITNNQQSEHDPRTPITVKTTKAKGNICHCSFRLLFLCVFFTCFQILWHVTKAVPYGIESKKEYNSIISVFLYTKTVGSVREYFPCIISYAL